MFACHARWYWNCGSTMILRHGFGYTYILIVAAAFPADMSIGMGYGWKGGFDQDNIADEGMSSLAFTAGLANRLISEALGAGSLYPSGVLTIFRVATISVT